MAEGYMYLIAIIDLHSRYVLIWSVSNTMDAKWCSDMLRQALGVYPPPEIFNTDQGSQFTSDEFTGILLDANIRVSMDGKGRALDNIFRGLPCGGATMANSQVRKHLSESLY
jgi:putative transposase